MTRRQAQNKFVAPQPTSGRSWRIAREEGFVVTLPSGNLARIKSIPLEGLIMSGDIPDLLSSAAATTLWKDVDTETIANDTQLSLRYVELITLITKLALAEPRIVDNPVADDEMSIDDVSFPDKLAIFQLATQPAEVLRQFRDEQNKRLETVRSSEDDLPETEQPDQSEG
jgi:hypothetical protein